MADNAAKDFVATSRISLLQLAHKRRRFFYHNRFTRQFSLVLLPAEEMHGSVLRHVLSSQLETSHLATYWKFTHDDRLRIRLKNTRREV